MDPAGLVNIRPLSGADLDAALPALARLRIEVFRAYPYLYAGSLVYEETYLRKFAQAKDAFIVAAETEDGEIVGCATGSGMDDQHAEFSQPLSCRGLRPADDLLFRRVSPVARLARQGDRTCLLRRPRSACHRPQLQARLLLRRRTP
jgi:hypothetical protein